MRDTASEKCAEEQLALCRKVDEEHGIEALYSEPQLALAAPAPAPAPPVLALAAPPAAAQQVAVAAAPQPVRRAKPQPSPDYDGLSRGVKIKLKKQLSEKAARSALAVSATGGLEATDIDAFTVYRGVEYSFKELCKDKRKRKVGSNERKEAEAKAKAAGAGAAGSSEGKGKGKAEACTYKEATGAYIERTPSSLDHWDVLRNPKRYKSKHKHA